MPLEEYRAAVWQREQVLDGQTTAADATERTVAPDSHNWLPQHYYASAKFISSSTQALHPPNPLAVRL